MKILLVHNTYQQPGGEDVVFEQERRLLLNAGHQVLTYHRTNYEADRLSAGQKLILPAKVVWSLETATEIEELLARFRPDIAHVHNTFMMVSPSVYYACKKVGVPIVQTLHNFRLLCPSAGFFRDGRVCEDCLDHGLQRSVLNGCYRSSRTATAVVAGMLKAHRLWGTWESIDRFIVLSEFARQKFVAGGFNRNSIAVKPNFIDPDPSVETGQRNGAVFLGRVSKEKGCCVLIDAWGALGREADLTIIGDGDERATLMEKVATSKMSGVRFAGRLSRDEAVRLTQQSQFLVLPSLLYEGQPMCIIESFACGTPVICSRLGGMREMVDDGRTGLHFTPGDAEDLARKVRWALEHPEEMAAMGRAARTQYETRYTAARNYQMLMDIYTAVISDAERRPGCNVA